MSVTENDSGLAAAPLVDAALIDGLRAALGPATDALVDRARGILDDRLAQLDAMADSPLDDRYARLAHEIAGVAGQIGLARLAQAALTLEQCSRNGDAGDAARAHQGLSAVATDTRVALAH